MNLCKKMGRKVFISLLLPLWLLTNSHAQADDPSLKDTSMTIKKLPNGFTYYLRKQPGGKLIRMVLVVRAGHLNEDPDQAELAHFLEHMPFVGTKHLKNPMLYFTGKGLKRGTQINAATGAEVTKYFLEFPSDSSLLIGDGLQYLRDCAHDITLDSLAIDNERGALLGELRNSDYGFNPMFRYIPKLTTVSTIAKNTEWNHEKNIKAFKHASLFRFYNDWYRPDLQSLIILGDFNEQVIEPQIKALFSDLVNPKNPRPVPVLTDDLVRPARIVVEQVYKGAKPNVTFMFRKPVQVGTNSNSLRALLIYSLLQKLFAERGSRKDLKPGAGDLLPTLKVPDLNLSMSQAILSFTIRTENPGTISDTKLIIREMERVKKHGFLQAELDKSRKGLIEEYARQNNGQLWEVADPIIEAIRTRTDPVDQQKLAKARISILPDISLQEVNEALRSLLGTEPDILILNQTGKTELTKQQVAQWRTEAVRTGLPQINEYVKPSSLFTTQEMAALKDSVEYSRSEVNGLTRIVFSNGVKLYLKNFDAAKTAAPYFRLFAERHEKSEKSVNQVGYPSTIMKKSGTSLLSPKQVEDLIETENILFLQNITPETATFSMDGAPDQADLILQLTYQVFKRPKKNKAAYDKEVAQPPVGDMPIPDFTVFKNFMDSVELSRGFRNPRVIVNQDFDKTYDAYVDRFSDPSRFTFFIVGHFDKDQLIKKLQKYIGNMRSSGLQKQGASQILSAEAAGPPSGIYEIHNNSAQDKAYVNFSYRGNMIMNQVAYTKLNMLRSVVERCLYDRLRNKEGGIYSLGIGCRTTRGGYNFSISYTPTVTLSKKLIAATIEELKELTTASPQVDSLFRAGINEYRGTLLSRQVADQGWMDNLIKDFEQGIDPGDAIESITLLDSITVDDLRRLAADLFLTGQHAIYLMTPKQNTKK